MDVNALFSQIKAHELLAGITGIVQRCSNQSLPGLSQQYGNLFRVSMPQSFIEFQQRVGSWQIDKSAAVPQTLGECCALVPCWNVHQFIVLLGAGSPSWIGVTCFAPGPRTSFTLREPLRFWKELVWATASETAKPDAVPMALYCYWRRQQFVILCGQRVLVCSSIGWVCLCFVGFGAGPPYHIQLLFEFSMLIDVDWSILEYNRRKFRSQTSDNMERWKAEQGRGREKRKIRRKKSRRERVRRQKMQMREKVGKSRNTVFFQWFVAPEGRKVGWLKRRVRSQLARGEMKNCTPLWREAHFEVKMYKTHHSRTTFGS